MTRRGRSAIVSLDQLRSLVSTDAAAAVDEASALLRDASVSPSHRCIAWSVLGRALFDLGRHRDATEAARRSVESSDDLDDPDDAVLVSLSAAAILAESGSVGDALDALDHIAADRSGPMLGRILVQRGYVLHHAGELHEALVALDRADQIFGSRPDGVDRHRLLVNRGLVLLQQGRLDAAEVDLREARAWAADEGLPSFEAMCAANLGVLHARARRIAQSLDAFAEAQSLYEQAGDPARSVAIMQIDRAETLLHHGLVGDAVDEARQAVQLIEPTGNRVVLADAQLMYARALLATGRFRLAARAAEVAAVSMASTGRERMVHQARAISVEAELALADDVERGAAAVRDAVAVADLMRSDGWVQLASTLQAMAVRAARRLGLVELVADDVFQLRLGAFATDRDVLLAGWYAEAVARAAEGELADAIGACRSGLGLLDDIVAEAPTLEQRSAAMRLGRDLSQLAIELAVELGDADTVLAAAEGTRARSLHEEMAHQRRHRPLTESGAQQLRSELATRLGDRTLVEWIEVRDETWAVVFGAAGGRLVRLGATTAVLRARDRVVMWLDRAAEEPDASSRNATRAVALLDELLLAPLGLPPGCEVVVVPVGGLHGIPWAGLPTFMGRSVTLAPNAQQWLSADRRATRSVRSVGVIIGPDVANAALERHTVEAVYADVSVAAGAGATAATVRSMFAGLDLVHVAAHGTFRADHPLLSTLRLHDGESTLYDTVPDRVVSRLVVLSSCQGGAHGNEEGSEVLGLAAVMLARGAAAVLAPLTIVRDLECAEFVVDVHQRLAAGDAIGRAVADVRQRWLADDDLSRWAVASSFTCFGSDAVRVVA